jgi:hypothetical protein
MESADLPGISSKILSSEGKLAKKIGKGVVGRGLNRGSPLPTISYPRRRRRKRLYYNFIFCKNGAVGIPILSFLQGNI